MSNCKHDRRFVRWEDHSQPIICTLCEIERLEKQVFDMGGLNDAWALECDQIKAKLVKIMAQYKEQQEAFHAEVLSLGGKLTVVEDDRDEARNAARWLLPFTINTPHTQRAVERWPWLDKASCEESDLQRYRFIKTVEPAAKVAKAFELPESWLTSPDTERGPAS